MSSELAPAVLRTILYVEDDPQLRCVAKIALEVIGRFIVRDCGVGGAAVRAAGDFSPDLILLDVTAPRCDAMQTLALLRALPHLAHTPAMLVTEMDADEALLYMGADAVGVLPKPLEPMRVASQLRELWAMSRRAPVARAGATSTHAGPGLL